MARGYKLGCTYRYSNSLTVYRRAPPASRLSVAVASCPTLTTDCFLSAGDACFHICFDTLPQYDETNYIMCPGHVNVPRAQCAPCNSRWVSQIDAICTTIACGY